MTHENRETLQRALGIIEGISYCVSAEAQDGLATATEMIVFVLQEEEK